MDQGGELRNAAQTDVRIAIATWLAAVALLAGRVFESYASAWILGLLAVGFVAVAGKPIERLTLASLALLALLAEADQRALDLRSCVFLALFMVTARLGAMPPLAMLLLELALLAIVPFVGDQGYETFAFGPSVLLLFIVARREQAGMRDGVRTLLFYLASLAIMAVGNGSRSALFVWVLALVRRLSVRALVALGVLATVLLVAPELPVLAKLGHSYEETLVERNDITGTFYLRGTENQIFSDYLTYADLRELAFGARAGRSIPGEYVGRPTDVVYLPHNQVYGIFYAFGFVGLGLVVAYFAALFLRNRGDRAWRDFLLILIPPFFLFKHGFLDVEFGLLLATLNWRPRPRSPAPPRP